MMKAQSCRRDRSNTRCDRKWRWVGQASNPFRDSSRGTLNGLGRINQQKPCGQKKQSSILERSEERRVGKECVSTCRSRGSQYHKTKRKKIHHTHNTYVQYICIKTQN